MRSSIFIATPFLAFVSAARISTVSYSNPLTSFLTQTNSNGVVTGQPGGATAMTSQPAVATIPAGLPTGETTFFYSASATLQSFAVSIGPSTTVVEGGNGVGPSASVVVGSSAGVGKATGKGKGSGNGGSGSSSSDNAAPTNVKAAAGMLAVGAVAAFFL